MARGNQRDKAREANNKKMAGEVCEPLDQFCDSKARISSTISPDRPCVQEADMTSRKPKTPNQATSNKRIKSMLLPSCRRSKLPVSTYLKASKSRADMKLLAEQRKAEAAAAAMAEKMKK